MIFNSKNVPNSSSPEAFVLLGGLGFTSGFDDVDRDEEERDAGDKALQMVSK